jgi:hypothetical protein
MDTELDPERDTLPDGQPPAGVFAADPELCVCKDYGACVRTIRGHHGQCRWLWDGDAVVGKTPKQALDELGPPRPNIPGPKRP